jgi:hypothetical protein
VGLEGSLLDSDSAEINGRGTFEETSIHVFGQHCTAQITVRTMSLKRWLLGSHRGAAGPQHLSYYLDEFTFRLNRRTCRSRGKLFYRLEQQAVVT